MEKSAEAKEKLDDEILGKLAKEVLYSTKRLTEEKPKPIFEFKKKKTVDNKKRILGGFGGLKVKGKALKEIVKPKTPPKEPEVESKVIKSDDKSDEQEPAAG